MQRALPVEFFDRHTVLVAKELLGKYLVRKIGRRKISGMITEVEAYVGPHDKASHASRGKTARNQIMFGPAGHWYVYFTYGMHWMLNAVTEREEYPAAVLIRSVDLVSGPGRLTRFFHIDKMLNGKPITSKTGLWIEDRGIKLNPKHIHHARRIGIGYAGAWQHKLWRFFL